MKFFDTLQKIPMGRETLEAVQKLGFDIRFEKGLSDAGCCDASKKVILLNPMMKERDLLPTFMHEARHALQSEILQVNDEKTLAADTIKAYRAMEADAVAFETAFVVEAQKAGVAVRSTPMVDLYRKIKDPEAAKAEVFRAWYADTNNLTLYDEFYADQFEVMAEKAAKRGDKECFCEPLPAAKISAVCPYVSPDFLDSAEAFSIRGSAKERISDALEGYAKKTGAKPDTSVQTMYSRAKNGKIIDDRVFPRNSAVALRLKAGKGRE
ncbi:MAG: hypothetical protein J5716_08935 [Alphaproteobacteria bacterium]|nr:hypothetical protein [Alphaproteobacteria bacterium]